MLASALCALGTLQARRHNFPQAITLFRAAAKIAPRDATAYHKLGNLMASLERYAEAVDSYREALRLNPGSAEAHKDLAFAFRMLERFDEAMASCRSALAIKPDLAWTHASLAVALHHLNRHAEAAASYREVLALEPSNAAVRVNYSFVLLALGNYADGWKEYEWRWVQQEHAMPKWNFPGPRWVGKQAVANNTVLLLAEQGLGDTLQFARYAPLKRLLSSLEGVAETVSTVEPGLKFDFYCPLLSLPYAFGTQLATIPATVPYLHADPDDAARWKARLADDTALKVGLVWAGSAREDNPAANRLDRLRSVALAEFAPLADVPGVRFFSLQKGVPARQAQDAPRAMALHGYTGELNDFGDTAALIDQLDLVITVDTSVAHLAGGMGKPVWILSRFHGCWRWLLDRGDSPWYPTAKLFRQPAPGDWNSVMKMVRDELLRFQQSHRRG